jgi:hypothetical protein
MIKKLNPALLILIQFLFLQSIDSQVPVNMTGYLTEKFSKYVKSVPWEEIYVHTDRDEYISGEDLWFNIYLIDRQSSKPSLDSKIAYFELLNPENRPVVQKRIRLDGGFGPGQIVLPDTLGTGRYTIRAYTNWMKNFLPSNCFIKEINIYNSFSNKTIKGELNSVKIIKGTNIRQNYPQTGITLRVNRENRDNLEINISADEKFRSDNQNLIYLFIQTHGIINYLSFEKLSDENTKISIPNSHLLPGINQITIFNSTGLPVAEKLIYTPEKENTLVTLHLADTFSVRNKISLNLEIGDGSTSSLNPGSYSISVASASGSHLGIHIQDYMIFGTEFGLTPWNVMKNKKISEIPGEVIDSLLQTVKSNWIDWEMILKDDHPVFNYQAEKESHYISGKLITGNQKSADSESFVIMSHPGKVATFQYAKTDDAGTFNFGIHIDDVVNDLIIQPDNVTKNQSVIIESSFWDQYPESENSSDSINRSIPPYISKWSANNQVRKIYGMTSVGEPLVVAMPRTNPKRFYGKPDNEIVMKDYIALPVMQEVFFELLVGVFLKSKKSGWEVTMNDPANNKTYSNPPGLFVDGVMVKDPNVIGGLDPDLVETIDVVRDKYFVGDYLFYGIVNAITKAGDFSNSTLPAYAIRLPYRVIDPVNSFKSTDYSSADMKKRRIPDFRNTLYWNQSVKTDYKGNSRLEFWASDFVSEFEVNIQGITQDGKTFSLKKIIEVKR